MSYMEDIIRIPQDLGSAVKKARKVQKRTVVEVAQHAGRSRDVLHRLERGDDVTVASLMDVLNTLGLVIRLERVGLPTLQEMQARFAGLDEDGE